MGKTTRMFQLAMFEYRRVDGLPRLFHSCQVSIQKSSPWHGWMILTIVFIPIGQFIELDDGKILTGKPKQFDGKNPWVSG